MAWDNADWGGAAGGALGSVGGPAGVAAGYGAGYGIGRMFDRGKRSEDLGLTAPYQPNTSDNPIVGQINLLFEQFLGRYPTKAEYESLKPLISGGQMTPMQLGQYLQGSPEAQETRLGQYGQQYERQLGANDEAILKRAADTTSSQFAQQGRQFSSGQGNSILQAGQQLAERRRADLADFYGQGLKSIMGQYGSQGQGAQARAYQVQDRERERGYDLSDYYLQQNDFNSYLRGQSTRNMQSALMQGGIGIVGGLAKGAGANLFS